VKATDLVTVVSVDYHLLSIVKQKVLSHFEFGVGVNQKFFLEFQHLQTKEQRIDYQRKHRNKIIRRCACCYTVPKRSDGTGGIDPKAILWRQHHPDNTPCEKCPFCILFPALHILYKVCSHASLLQLKLAPSQFSEGTEQRTNADYELKRLKLFIPQHVLSELPGKSYVRQNGIMVRLAVKFDSIIRMFLHNY
jgi:hypothetical protein